MSRAPLIVAAVLTALGVAVVLAGLVFAITADGTQRCPSPKVVTTEVHDK